MWRRCTSCSQQILNVKWVNEICMLVNSFSSLLPVTVESILQSTQQKALSSNRMPADCRVKISYEAYALRLMHSWPQLKYHFHPDVVLAGMATAKWDQMSMIYKQKTHVKLGRTSSRKAQLTSRNYVSNSAPVIGTNAAVKPQKLRQSHCSLNRGLVTNSNQRMRGPAAHRFDCGAAKVWPMKGNSVGHHSECWLEDCDWDSTTQATIVVEWFRDSGDLLSNLQIDLILWKQKKPSECIFGFDKLNLTLN